MTDRLRDDPASSYRLLLRCLLAGLLMITVLPAGLGWRLIKAYAELPTFRATIQRTINLATATIPAPASGQGITVAPDGAVFVADLAGGRLLGFPAGTQESGFVLATGIGGQVLRGFGLALSPQGTIWFLENPTGRVHVFTRTGNLLRSLAMGSPGARCIAIDITGNIYVGDTGAHVVRKYLPSGNPDASWGDDSSSGSVHLGEVIGLAVSHGRLYATSPESLLVLDDHGKLLIRRRLMGPAGMLAAAPEGTIFMSDISTNRVWVYTGDGRLLGRVAAADGESEIFGQPRGLAVPRDGSLYVVNDSRITIYSFAKPPRHS